MTRPRAPRWTMAAGVAAVLMAGAVGLGGCGTTEPSASTSASTTPPAHATPTTPFRVCGHDAGSIVCGGCVISANAHCPGADLSNVALGGQAMQGADLSGANLRGARLAQVAFSGANLSGADLSGADLSQTDLTGANLSGANLSGAIVEGTYWSETICPDNTSSDAQGGTCIGAAPSPV